MSVNKSPEQDQLYGRPDQDINAAEFFQGVLDGTVQIVETPPNVTPVEIRRGIELSRVRTHGSGGTFSKYNISTLGKCCVLNPSFTGTIVPGAEPCEGAVFAGFELDHKDNIIARTECPARIADSDLPCLPFSGDGRRRSQVGVYVSPFTLGDEFVDALVDKARPETQEDFEDIVRDLVKNFAYREKVTTFRPWPDEKDEDNEPRTYHSKRLLDKIRAMNDSNVEHMGDDYSVNASVVDIASKLFGLGPETPAFQERSRNIALAWLELRTSYRIALETKRRFK